MRRLLSREAICDTSPSSDTRWTEALLGASGSTRLKNLALAIVSVVLILFLVEMVLRVTEVVPSRTLEYASADSEMSNPGPFLPDQFLVDRFTRGLPYRVSINGLGFRGSP